MIDYRKIAENIAEVKDIFNEELSVRDSFSLLRYLREKDTEHMTPTPTTDNYKYYFSMGDMRWCNDFECEEDNEWDDAVDDKAWRNEKLNAELEKLDVEVVDWDKNGIYVEF